MSDAGSEHNDKKRKRRWLLPGCLFLIALMFTTVVAWLEWTAFQLESPSILEIPGAPGNVEMWLYSGGFVDRWSWIAVTDTRETEKVYLLSTDYVDIVDTTLLVSGDSQLAVAATDVSRCRGQQSPPNPFGVSDAVIIYTHAYEFGTGRYIATRNPCSENTEVREARHEEIRAMLAEHGGEGTRHTFRWNPTDARKLTYWEWRRWRGELKEAHQRLTR